MGMRYCFRIDGRVVCIDIPVLVNLWPWVDPNPPDPWIEDELLNPRVVQDLAVLATITKLTEQLSPVVGDLLRSGITGAAEQLELPSEVTLGFSRKAG
jgi:hypothetical protein